MSWNRVTWWWRWNHLRTRICRRGRWGRADVTLSLPRCWTADSDRSGFYSSRFVLDGSADVTAVFKSMTSLHMTASPRSGPTRQKTRRILVDAAVWMFQADRGASGAAGQLPPHRGEDGGRGCQSASRFQNETTGQRWQNPKIHDTREDVSLRSFN